MACDTQTLVNEANCIQCAVPRGLMLPIAIVQAARIAGVSADPASLLALAKCDECAIPVGMQWPVLIALACNIVNGGGGPPPATCSDADASAFIAAAGISDNTTINALCTLVTSLKAVDIWSRADAIYPMVGGTSASCSYNLKNPATLQITWTAGMSFGAAGALANGPTDHGDTGFNPSIAGGNFSLNSGALFAYSTSTGCLIGVTDLAGNIAKIAPFVLGVLNVAINDTAQASPGGAVGTGSYVASRTASNNTYLYYPGGNSTDATASTALPNGNLWVANLNNVGGIVNANAIVSFAGICGGLNPTQIGLLRTALTAFQTALGRA